MKSILAMIAVMFMVSACLSMPKTREEYVNMAEARGSSDIKTEVIINKPISTVNKNLAYLSKNCLNKTVTMEYQMKSSTGYERGKTVIDYHSSFRTVSRKKSEFTIQSKPQGLYLGPAEPVFVFAADASPVNKNRTRLKMYKSHGYDRFVNIVKDAASGARKKCPENIH